MADCHDTEDLERETAKAASIVQVSETIIKTAEVENQFIAITKSLGSGFVPIVNTGNPKSLIKQIEEAANQTEYFDETKEKNWLMDGGEPNNLHEKSSIPVHKIHKAGE